jgi:hypothetical protein
LRHAHHPSISWHKALPDRWFLEEDEPLFTQSATQMIGSCQRRRFLLIAVPTLLSVAFVVQGFSVASNTPSTPSYRRTIERRTPSNNNEGRSPGVRPLHVSANLDTISASKTMKGGQGGRIEDAFRAAKAKGEAAFITFVTAGYPTAHGTSLW